MLILLSPAKIQDFQQKSQQNISTIPLFPEEANYLMEELRKLSEKQIAELLKVNKEIALKTFDEYFNWSSKPTHINSKQALFVYAGEVYRGLKANDFSETDIDFAQKHLRIFSVLYGVLRPLDLIQPYRFEMSAKLYTKEGHDMYAFWREKMTKAIHDAAEKSGEPQALLNLASNEYFKTLDKKEIKIPIIYFDFLENRNGIYKPITIYVKKARGLMARYIIKNKIDKIEDLKGFDSDSYWFNSTLSTENKFVFTRG